MSEQGTPAEDRARDEDAIDVGETSPSDGRREFEQRIAQLEDRLRRQEADFVNETRRIRRQADEQARYAADRVVQDLLPVLDALHGAAQRMQGSDAAAADERSGLREGFDLVGKQLADVLRRHGVEEIEALGRVFDPACHEAMLVLDDPTRPSQSVAAVLRPGWRLHGRVVRPAQVAVARGGPDAAPSEDFHADV